MTRQNLMAFLWNLSVLRENKRLRLELTKQIFYFTAFYLYRSFIVNVMFRAVQAPT